MPVFVYDGTVPTHTSWAVHGHVFPAGVPVFVTDAQAAKLRRLPFFFEVGRVDGAGDTDGTAPGAVVPVAIEVEAQAPAIKRKRGRPPGSKNRSKVIHGDENAG